MRAGRADQLGIRLPSSCSGAFAGRVRLLTLVLPQIRLDQHHQLDPVVADGRDRAGLRASCGNAQTVPTEYSQPSCHCCDRYDGALDHWLYQYCHYGHWLR